MKTPAGSFSIEQLRERLALLPLASRIWVGFSGGADSTALLIALKELECYLPAEFEAVHFNHGLQGGAEEWERHCQSFCDARDIPIRIHRLELNIKEGQSSEEQARDARYRVVENILDEGHVYLTAHHADDNAETLFLNLMRGSGMEGLAGVPGLRSLGKGWVARPLLDFRRCSLQQFLHSRGISWIHDPSNLNTSFDRNYVRNSVFPALENRWPGLVNSLNQTSQNARDSVNALECLLLHPQVTPVIDAHTLSLDRLLALKEEVQTAMLRHWVKGKGVPGPPRRRLQQFLKQLRSAPKKPNHAELSWAGQKIKRHKSNIWWLSLPLPCLAPALAWESGARLPLGPEFGSIQLLGSVGVNPPGWEVGPVRQGARMKLHASGPRRKLMDLLREWGVPPWFRCAVPVLYWNGAAAALGDRALEPGLKTWLAEHDAKLQWHPESPLLIKLKSVCVQATEGNNMQHG